LVILEAYSYKESMVIKLHKEQIPINYPLATEKKWAVYFWSLMEHAVENNSEQCSAFVDPRQQDIARDLFPHFTAVSCSFFGGYPEAERIRLCVRPLSLRASAESGRICCLVLDGEFPEGILTHRDFLGTLLGLGIKREMVGDIIYRGGKQAYVFLIKDMAPFVRDNLSKIGRYTIEVSELELDSLPMVFEPRRVKEIKGTVASMRLDAVAGLGFSLSRSKITPLIKGERVKLNHQFINQPSKTVKEGDIISLIGKGRIEVVSQMGESKKGRTHLLLHRMV